MEGMQKLFFSLNELIIRKHKDTWLLVLLVILSCIVIFHNFLSLKDIYVFNDVGSDSYDCFWPMLYSMISNLRIGAITYWAHNWGIGTNYFSTNVLLGDIFLYPIAFFPAKNAIYFLPYLFILKLIVASIGFRNYLKEFCSNRFVLILFPWIYSFNGYLMLWSQHYWFQNVMVFLPFIMWGIEALIKRNNLWIFLIATSMMAFYSFYFMFFTSILIFPYYFLRILCVNNKINFKKTLMQIFGFVLIYFVSISVVSFKFLPDIVCVLNSARVETYINVGILHLYKLNSYVTILSRFFSNSLQGMNFQYYGAHYDCFNWYESPIFYASILIILLFPQILLIIKEKYKRIALITAISVVSIMLVFPFFAAIFSMFHKIDYRWTYIVIFLIITAVAIVYENFNLVNNITLFGTFVIAICLLSGIALYSINISGGFNDFLIAKRQVPFMLSLLYLSLYFILLVAKKNYGKYDNLINYFIILLVIVEMLGNAYVENNNRTIIDYNKLKSQQISYYDNTSKAIEYIKHEEPKNSFYRVEKAYNSRYLNDALMQDYNGTKIYSALNNSAYLNWLHHLDLLEQGNDHTISGVNEREMLLSILSVKYYLTKIEKAPFGFSKIRKINDINIYKNNYYLPVASLRAQIYPESLYLKLNQSEKEAILYTSAVISDSDLKSTINIKKAERPKAIFSEYFDDKINYSPGKAIHVKIPDKGVSEAKRYEISYNYNSDILTRGKITWLTKGQKFEKMKNQFLEYDVMPGSKRQKIDLGYINGLEQVYIIPDTIYSQARIDKIKLEEQDIDVYHLNNMYKKLNNDLFLLDSYDNNKFNGHIYVRAKSVLVFSIPFDNGWNAFVNGKHIKPFDVNDGFVGVTVNPGNNIIQLYYYPPGLKEGVFISLIMLLLIGVYFVIKKYFAKQRLF